VPATEVAVEDLSVLSYILEGTARTAGMEFLQSLVMHLAKAIGVQYAFVAEFAGSTSRARTLAFWANTAIQPNIEWDLHGTPCYDVANGSLCHYPSRVAQRFPDDKPLIDLGIESYLGVPLLDAAGNSMGHLAVFDERPMPAEPQRLYVFRIFAARAAVELERLRAEKELRESEERFRDLYEQAPNAYVSLDAEGRLHDVNQRTLELLGHPAEAIVGRPLSHFFGDSPSSRKRAEDALHRFLSGEEVANAEIELRRKDGRPLWVSLGLKPTLKGGKPCGGRSMWVDISDRVLAEAERARLAEQNRYLQEEIRSVHNFGEIVGASPAVEAVLENVRRVAPTDSTVLITGETGTGKELVARAIHEHSRRKDRPLIKVNCAALPSHLVESELFGHEKGAFTGALTKRVGRFELADGGTLFLDEVGELPLDAQAKLLRVLQEHEVDRIGGKAPIRVDVRIIAATNRDLLRAVKEKTFREDLYYRLSVFPVHLPPLRDRKSDIAALVESFVRKFAAKIGKRVRGLAADALERLIAYSWPGNIRELENIIERAVILSSGEEIDIGTDVFAGAPAGTPAGDDANPGGSSLRSLDVLERDYMVMVLRQTNWVIEGPSGAAAILGLHPNTLRSRLKRQGITREVNEGS
jgi:PAS domain S-box-containing protein